MSELLSEKKKKKRLLLPKNGKSLELITYVNPPKRIIRADLHNLPIINRFHSTDKTRDEARLVHHHQNGRGMGEMEGDDGFRGTVEGGFPPGVKDHVVQRPLKALRSNT